MAVPAGPVRHVRGAAANLLQVVSQLLQQQLCRVIAFRMHSRRIQRVFTVHHAQEAGALLESLRPQLRHFLQRRPAGDPVFFPVGNDVFRQRRADARHMAQQFRRRRADFHAYLVYALLHHTVQGGAQFILLQVVLVLSHADGLRVNLHQFSQRILHAAGDRYRAALGHVKVRKLLRGQLAGAVYRSSRLAHDHIGRPRQFRQQGYDELFAFPAGRSVADGDCRNAVFLCKGLDQPCRFRLFRLRAGQREISYAGIQHLAVFVHHSQLAAGPEARIHAKSHLALDGRLHQQLMQVVAEDLDCADVRPVGQVAADFPLQGRKHQPFPGVRAGFGHLLRGRRAVPHKGPADHFQGFVFRNLQGNLQEFLPLAPVYRQDPVRRNGPHRFPEIIIHAVYAVFLLRGFAPDDAFPVQQRPQVLPDLRAVAHSLGKDIPRAGQGRLRVRHFLFRIDILRRFRRRVSWLLQHQPHRQRFQSALLRHGGTGPTFRTVRAVDILQFAQRCRFGQLFLQFVRHHALFFQGRGDLFPPLLQVPQVLQPFRHFTQHLVVQRSGRFLPVPRDKRDRISRVQQFHRRLYLLRSQLKLRCQPVYKIHLIQHRLSFPISHSANPLYRISREEALNIIMNCSLNTCIRSNPACTGYTPWTAPATSGTRSSF